MASLQSFTDPRTYHILTYGTLLGSNLFQTFLAGPLAYTCLPRPQFSTLQQKIFPPFFTLQTALPLVLALTWPGEKVAGVAGAVVRRDAGLMGLLEPGNLWTAMLPIALMFGTSGLNLTLFGPLTTKVMRQRKHQETREGKKYYDPGPKSAEMQRLNSAFSRMHGASSLSNLIGLGALLYYGFVLAESL